jgi:hypothetical protein
MASTASFITASNVRGPFGTSSISSASYASGSTSASFSQTASFITPTGTNAFVLGGNSFSATAILGTNDNQSLQFETSGSVRITLDNLGNTNIASGYQFSSGGTLNWGTNGYNIGQLSWDTAGGANNYAAVYAQGIYNLRLGTTTYPTSIFVTSSNGNVGIGTTNPDAKLRVAGTVNSTHSIFSNIDGRGLAIQTVIISGTNDAGSILNARGAGEGTLILQTDSTERARITKDGNVGIGTTNPTAKLHISGSTGGLFEVDGAGTTGANALYVSASGNVGIGTSTTVSSTNYRSLSIAGTNGAELYMYAGSTQYGYMYADISGMVLSAQTNAPLIFRAGGNEHIRLTTGGNVGIGTTSPSTKLHISGANGELLRLQAPGVGNNYIGFNSGSTSLGYVGYGSVFVNNLSLVNYMNAATNIGTNNTVVMTVTGSNVGIGTNDPKRPLEVISTVNDFVSVGVANLGNNGWAGIHFGQAVQGSNTNRKSAIVFERDDIAESNGAGKIHILNGPQLGNGNATLSDARLTIGKTGNVGIGTRNPTSASLQVNGNVHATSFTGSLLGTATTAITASIVNGTLGQLLSSDNRTISPSEINAGYLQFGFTAWNNNGTAPYADYLHMRSYTDFTAGSDNLVVFKKEGIGARIYQAVFGTGSQYSTFKDIVLVSGSSGAVNTYVPLWMGDNSLTSSVINQVSNYVGIDKVSPTSKLDVNGIIVAGNTTTTNGSVILQDQYSAGHITNFGTNFSSGGPVIGYCVYPSSSIENTFASSVTNALNIPRAAFSFDGSFRWYTGVAQALNIGVQATLTQKMTLTNTGDLGIGTASPSYKADISGSTRVLWSLAVGNITPSATKGRIDAEHDVVAFSTSDNRFKTNVTSIPNALEKITQIGGYEFDWIPNQELHGFEGHDVGVIAQEIEKVLPEVVTTRDSGYKAVKYEKIVPLLIEAIKEQQKQIDELKNLIQNGSTI